MFAISPDGELLSGTQSRQSDRAVKVPLWDTYGCPQRDASRQSGRAVKVPHIPPIGHLWGLGGTMFAISPDGELLSGTQSRQSC
jgi:hypothetical protein